MKEGERLVLKREVQGQLFFLSLSKERDDRWREELRQDERKKKSGETRLRRKRRSGPVRNERDRPTETPLTCRQV